MTQTQPTGPTLKAGILTGTWPIRKVVSNSLGDLVFSAGNFHGGPDGLVLVTPDKVVKLAATGDGVPGRQGVFLESFGLQYSNTDFSFNDQHDLAFIALVLPTGSRTAGELFFGEFTSGEISTAVSQELGHGLKSFCNSSFSKSVKV